MGESIDVVLAGLLDEDLSSSPTTARGLTNHLPMAVLAKERLGASAEELRRFAKGYRGRNQPLVESDERLTSANWRGAIGRAGAEAALRRYFHAQIGEFGIGAVLEEHLDALVPGIGGAGFHGTIRLAYALEDGDPARVAAGLAYFAQVARPLAALPEASSGSDDVAALWRRLSRAKRWDPPSLATIDQEMRAAATQPEFLEVMATFAPSDQAFSTMATSALALYATSDNFTALHTVTGLAAARDLRAWASDRTTFDRYLFQGLLAAYLSIGAPALWSKDRLQSFAAQSEAPLEQIRHAGAYATDEHVAKVIYTASREYSSSGNALYLAVASRAASRS